MSETGKYDHVAITLHWLIAALMIPMLLFGEELMEAEAEEGFAASTMPSLHVSLGIAILILSFLRLGWRFANPPPPLPAGMANWEVALARITHGLFYFLMIALPITGWLILGEFVREEHVGAVSFFGLLTVPPGPAGGDLAEAVHKLGSKIGIALVILHTAAALKHQFINRDRLLARILPG